MGQDNATETTSIGDSWRTYGHSSHVEKGNVDAHPKQFTLECENIRIVADGPTSRNVKIYIDGMEARGVYDLHVHFNTKRMNQLTLGVFLNQFKFALKPKEAKETKP